MCQANNQTDKLNPYARFKKCFAILRLASSNLSIANTAVLYNNAVLCKLGQNSNVCNSVTSSTHRLFECKNSSNVRDSFMNKMNGLHTLVLYRQRTSWECYYIYHMKTMLLMTLQNTKKQTIYTIHCLI